MSPSVKRLVGVVCFVAIVRTVAGDDLEAFEDHSGRDRCGNRCNGKSPDDMRVLLQLPPFTGLAQRGTYKTLSGKTKVRYQQVLSGVSIYGTLLSVELDNAGAFTGKVNGELVRSLTGTVMKANVSPLEALRALASKYYARKTNQLQLSDFEFYDHKLTWYPQKSDGRLRFSYLCRLKLNGAAAAAASALTGEPLIPRGVVDAVSGQVIVSWNDVGFQLQPQPYLLTGIGGNVGSTGRVYHRDISVVRLPDNVTCQYSTDLLEVQNLAGSVSSKLFSAARALCADANSSTFDFVNGGYSALNEAIKYGQVVINMYRAYLNGTNPVTNMPLKIRVHYGTDYANAFWDGSMITMGDGGSSFYPLTSLDIIAHEVGHGYTHSNSDLQLIGEPGAINEAFSDAVGLAAKYFHTGSTEFTIGKQVTKNGGPIRDMCQPTVDGKSIDNYARYPRPNSGVTMDPHYASGLYNKAFCLLAKTPGWSVPSTFYVFAKANEMYWAQLTTLAKGVCGVRNAAIDARGDPLAVDRAFAAVGLACPTIAR